MRRNPFYKRAIFTLLFILPLSLCRMASAEGKDYFRPRICLKLTGGLGRIAVGDLNTHLESFNNNYEFKYLRENSPESITGEIKTLDNRINDWEAELRLDLSSRFSFGISTSWPFRLRNESSLTDEVYFWWYRVTTLTVKPEVRAGFPVRLSIYYGLPFIFRTRITFSAGIGCYWARISKSQRTDEIIYMPDEYFYWSSGFWKTNWEAGVGFHGGLELEYSLTRNLAIVVEAQGRYVKIGNIKGVYQGESSENPGRISNQKGTVWFFWILPDPEGICSRYTEFYSLAISEEPPNEIWMMPEITEVRKAIIDLSGFSLRVGIKIKLI